MLKKSIIVRISPELHKRAMIKRAETGLSLARVLRASLMAWVDEEGEPRKFTVEIK